MSKSAAIAMSRLTALPIRRVALRASLGYLSVHQNLQQRILGIRDYTKLETIANSSRIKSVLASSDALVDIETAHALLGKSQDAFFLQTVNFYVPGEEAVKTLQILLRRPMPVSSESKLFIYKGTLVEGKVEIVPSEKTRALTGTPANEEENFSIEKVSPEDWPKIKSEIMQIESSVFHGVLRQSEDDLRRTFEDINSISLIARDKSGKIIGYTAGGPLEDYSYVVDIEDEQFYRPKTFYVESTAIAESNQGQGIGKVLKERLIQAAKERGYQYISGHARTGASLKLNLDAGAKVVKAFKNWNETGETYCYYFISLYALEEKPQIKPRLLAPIFLPWENLLIRILNEPIFDYYRQHSKEVVEAACQLDKAGYNQEAVTLFKFLLTDIKETLRNEKDTSTIVNRICEIATSMHEAGIDQIDDTTSLSLFKKAFELAESSKDKSGICDDMQKAGFIAEAEELRKSIPKSEGDSEENHINPFPEDTYPLQEVELLFRRLNALADQKKYGGLMKEYTEFVQRYKLSNDWRLNDKLAKFILNKDIENHLDPHFLSLGSSLASNIKIAIIENKHKREEEEFYEKVPFLAKKSLECLQAETKRLEKAHASTGGYAYKVIYKLIDAQMYHEAFCFAEIYDKGTIYVAMRNIAIQAMIEHGALDEAVEALDKILNNDNAKKCPDIGYSGTLLCSIPLKYAKKSQFEKALSVANNIKSVYGPGDQKTYVCNELALSLADAGKFQVALNLISEKIDRIDIKRKAIFYIIIKMIAAGEVKPIPMEDIKEYFEGSNVPVEDLPNNHLELAKLALIKDFPKTMIEKLRSHPNTKVIYGVLLDADIRIALLLFPEVAAAKIGELFDLNNKEAQFDWEDNERLKDFLACVKRVCAADEVVSILKKIVGHYKDSGVICKFFEIASAFVELGEKDSLISKLCKIGFSKREIRDSKGLIAAIDSMNRFLLGKLVEKLAIDIDLSTVSEEYLNWDSAHFIKLVRIADSLEEADKINLAYVIKHALLGDFKESVSSSGEISGHNQKIKTELKVKGIDIETWLNYKKTKTFSTEGSKQIGTDKAALQRELEDTLELLFGSFSKKKYGLLIQDDADEKFAPQNYSKKAKPLITELNFLLAKLTLSYKNGKLISDKSDISDSDLVKLCRFLIKQIERHLEKKKDSQTIEDARVAKTHLNGIIEKIMNSSPTLSPKILTIRMWARLPQIDLFQGNYTSCCIAIDGDVGKGAIIDYLLDQGIGMIEIANNAGKIISNALVWLAEDENGKTTLAVDNLEVESSYRKKEVTDMIMKNLVEYVKQLAREIGVKRIVMGTAYNGADIEPFTSKPDKKIKLKKIGGSFKGEKYYFDVFGGWVDPSELQDTNSVEVN